MSDELQQQPDWIAAIARGDWDAAEEALRNRIIAKAGPAYQQMKLQEDTAAIAQRSGASPDAVKAALLRVSHEEQLGKLNNINESITRFSQVLDDTIKEDYFAKRKADEDRRHGREL